MASPEKLKKYQKEKFESYKKINNLKVNDNEAYIEITNEYVVDTLAELADKLLEYKEEDSN